MTIGITGLVIPQDWDYAATFERIRSAGYTSFEPAIRDSGWLTLDTTDAELDEIRQRAKEAGVELVSTCPSIRNRPKDLMTDDSALRKEGIRTVV